MLNEGKKSVAIEKERLLLVEGKDEINFFQAFFSNLGISNIQIINVGGKYQFSNQISLLKIMSSNFREIKKIGFIRDADDNIEFTFKSMSGAIKNIGLQTSDSLNIFYGSKPSIGIFIMPGKNHKNGMLEDLCLAAVSDDPRMECVNEYFCCIEKINNSKIDKIQKRKTQVYLTSVEKLCKDLGIAAKKQIWNFQSAIYDELKEFINDLSN